MPKNILIDGVECVTLPDVAALVGATVDTVRQRQRRGTFDLIPHIIIGKQQFFALEDVRAAMRKGLSS